EVNFWPCGSDSPLIQSERGVGLWLSKKQLSAPHDPARAKGVGFMITRTSQPASGAMLISEMKEFASFPKATQRYIRRSLDVAYGRRDAIECWARDEGEAASIRAQARLYKQLDHLRLQVPDDSGLDMIEPFLGILVVNEHDSRGFVGLAVLLAVVHEYVAGMHMRVLVAGHAGDDRHSREMPGRPFDLLRRRPLADR